MIKNIIFDLGGVLLDISMARTMKALADLGLNMQAMLDKHKGEGAGCGTTMCEGVSAVGILDEYSKGNIGTDEFLLALQAECRPGTTIEQVRAAWNACLFTIPLSKMEAIRELRKDYRVYMLSNTNDAHWVWIAENSFPKGIDPYKEFDHIFLSQEMRLAKPDPKIFTQMLAEIGAEANECLFIDDTSANTEVAAQMGFRTYTAQIATLAEDGTFARPKIEWCDVIHDLLK